MRWRNGLIPASVLVALALAVPLSGQDTRLKPILGAADSTDPSPVRESAADTDARDRLEWLRDRFGGDLGQDFARRVQDEAAKERSRHPGHFVPTQGPSAGVPVSGNAWRSLGPTSSHKIENGVMLHKVNSGRLRAILTHPTDPGTVYVLASGGGLWKTTNFLDADTQWVPKTDFIGSTTGGAVTFGRSPNTVYLGTGDPFDEGSGGFVLKTVDGGDTWSSPIFLGSSNKVLDIKVDSSVGYDIVLAGTNRGLFRSRDGGATFTDVGAPFTDLQVWSLVRTKAGWLATATTQDAFGNSAVGSMYVSTNRGATWSPIPNTGTYFSGASRTTLATGNPGDAVVYALAAGVPDAKFSYPQRDLFRSIDGGLNWTPLQINHIVPFGANRDAPDMGILGGQAWYNQMILVDPTDPSRNTVYLGGQLFSAKSEDGGNSWTVLTDWLGQFGLPYAHSDFHCAAFSAVGGVRRVLFGNDGGLFVSSDDGHTWDDTKNRGLTTHLPYTISSNPTSGNTDSVLMGLQDNGTAVRLGNSSVFDQTLGGDGMGVGWSQATNAVSMTSLPGGTIVRAVNNPPDDQSKWARAMTGLSGSAWFFTVVENSAATADPTGLVFYTVRPGGVFRTSNGAASWTRILTQGSGGVSANRNVSNTLFPVGISPVDTQHLAVVGLTRFWISTTGTSPWTELNLADHIAGWQERGTASVAWADDSLLYVSSETPVAGATRFAKSTNSGLTWTAPANAGLPDLPVGRIRVDPSDGTGNTVYAATWIGVYKTTDAGENWSHVGAGLPQVRISDIYVAPGGAYVRVAAYGRGAWDLVVSAPPDASVTTAGSVVQGQRDIQASAPLQPGATYVWNIRGGSITSGQYDHVMTYAAGAGTSLTLSLTVTNGDGAAASSSLVVPVTPAPAPDATITAPAVATQGATGLVASVPTQVGATYAWSITNGRITSLDSGPSIIVAAGSGPSLMLQAVVINGAGNRQVGIKRIELVAALPPDTTITADDVVDHGAGGRHASVPNQSGATYAWSIDGGHITSRVDGAAITYTAGLDRNLTLRVTVTSAAGIVLSAARIVAVQWNGQYLGNPGFELGDTYWQGSVDKIGFYSSFYRQSGSLSAVINGYGVENTEALWQAVSVPADAYSARLGFWLRVGSADRSGVPHDVLTAQVRDAVGNPLATLATYSNRDRIFGWRWKTFDLSAYRGQTIQIYFEGTENDSLFTAFGLDDFSLDVEFLAPPAPSGEYLLNRGLEAGRSFWQGSAAGSTSMPLFNDGVYAHSGLWYAYISGYGFQATDTLFQAVTIPSTATSATFSYWLQIGTDELGGDANDTLDVNVLDLSGNLLKKLASYSNLNAGPYVQYSFDFSAYRGQTILVFMKGTENESLQTSFFMDDFSLQVSTPPGPFSPDANITAPFTAPFKAQGLTASAPSQPGATYAWTITGGAITAGQGSNTVTFDAGPGQTVTLKVTVTNGIGSSEGSHLLQISRQR